MLTSSVSHSIKGLLTGLDGGIYLVDSGLAKSDENRVKRGWEMVRRNVDRIRSLVLDVLYYAKDREPNLESASPVAIAEEACSAVESRAEQHHVLLERDFDASAGTFEVDIKAVRTMLVNLIENSVDACRVDHKKPEHRVTVRTRSQGDLVCLEVADNGIGMDPETRDKTFTAFFSSKGTEGTGLGLFIASKIAQAHGGQIAVESKVDRGTCFRALIPRSQPVPSAPSKEAAVRTDPPASEPTSKDPPQAALNDATDIRV